MWEWSIHNDNLIQLERFIINDKIKFFIRTINCNYFLMPKNGFKRNNKITICKRSIHFYQIMEAKRFKINDWLIIQKDLSIEIKIMLIMKELYEPNNLILENDLWWATNLFWLKGSWTLTKFRIWKELREAIKLFQ